MGRLLGLLVAAVLLVACSDSPDSESTVGSAVAPTTSTATPGTDTPVTPPPSTTASTTASTTPPDTIVDLPDQPEDVPFPTDDWPTGDLPAGVDQGALDQLATAAFGGSTGGGARSLLVVHRGRLVYEAYAPQYDADSVHESYSVAKSVTSAAIGMLVDDGMISLDGPAPVAGWDDNRQEITVEHLLHMASGLEWFESYEAGSAPLEMLAANDASESAADHPLVEEPGTVFNYSTGTTAILAQIMTDAAWAAEQGAQPDPDVEPDPEAGIRFLEERLFDPIGVTSVEFMRDPEGTWLGGLGANMTSRDFARFGLLYMRDGVWDGQRVLPEGWVQYSFTPSPADAEYGAQWWLTPDEGRFEARGLLGQLVVLVPADDLLVVVNSNDGGTAADLVDAVLREFDDR